MWWNGRHTQPWGIYAHKAGVKPDAGSNPAMTTKRGAVSYQLHFNIMKLTKKELAISAFIIWALAYFAEHIVK